MKEPRDLTDLTIHDAETFEGDCLPSTHKISSAMEGYHVTGPRRSLGLKLSDTSVYEPHTRARLGTTAHLCRVVVLK